MADDISKHKVLESPKGDMRLNLSELRGSLPRIRPHVSPGVKRVAPKDYILEKKYPYLQEVIGVYPRVPSQPSLQQVPEANTSFKSQDHSSAAHQLSSLLQGKHKSTKSIRGNSNPGSKSDWSAAQVSSMLEHRPMGSKPFNPADIKSDGKQLYRWRRLRVNNKSMHLEEASEVEQDWAGFGPTIHEQCLKLQEENRQLKEMVKKYRRSSL